MNKKTAPDHVYVLLFYPVHKKTVPQEWIEYLYFHTEEAALAHIIKNFHSFKSIGNVNEWRIEKRFYGPTQHREIIGIYDINGNHI